MKRILSAAEERTFCYVYLRTMDPRQAAAAIGWEEGEKLLENPKVRQRMERMRSDLNGEIRREDAVRRLSELAFGKVNDAAALAEPEGRQRLGELDLSAVSELKIGERGIEVKFLDRVRALETLCKLLGENREDTGDDFFRALEDAAEEETE